MTLDEDVISDFILGNLKGSDIITITHNSLLGLFYYVTFNPLVSDCPNDLKYVFKKDIPSRGTWLDFESLGDLKVYPLIRFSNELMTEFGTEYDISNVILESCDREGSDYCFGNMSFDCFDDKNFKKKKKKVSILFSPVDILVYSLVYEDLRASYRFGFREGVLFDSGVYTLPLGRENQMVFYKDGRVRF